MLLTIRRLRHDEQLTVARTRELIQEMKKSGKKRPVKAKRAVPVVVEATNGAGAGQAKRAASEASEGGCEGSARAGPASVAQVRRRLAEMRQAVLELLSAVEE